MSLQIIAKRISLIGTLFILMGCTHALEVKNLSYFRPNQISSMKRNYTVGLICNNTDPSERVLARGVSSYLSSQCGIIFPYSYNSPRKVDYVVILSVGSQYNGSGWNFLINWPGFLIFTPAWNGYIYDAKYNVSVGIKKGEERQDIGNFNVPIELDIRHANYNRTWTEISYLEVSLIAFISGLVFVNYDHNVTPLLLEKIEYPIGEYLAQEIISRIAAHDTSEEKLGALN